MVPGGVFLYVYIFWQCFILSKAEIDRVQTYVSWQCVLIYLFMRLPKSPTKTMILFLEVVPPKIDFIVNISPFFKISLPINKQILLFYILRERNMLSMWLYWIYGRYLCNLLPTRLLFKPYITFHHRPGVPYFIIHDTTHDHKSLLRRRFILKVSEMPSLFHTLISMLNSYILKMIVFADIKEMKPF